MTDLEHRLLTTEQMAGLLEVSPSKLARLTAERVVPAVTLGRKSPRYHAPTVIRCLVEQHSTAQAPASVSRIVEHPTAAWRGGSARKASAS